MVIATNPFVYLRGDILEVKTMNDYPHLQLPAAPPQLQRKEKIKLKDEVKVDELSCRPSCRTSRRYIVGAEISTLYKSQSIRHHESESAGGWMNWV